MLVLRDSLSLLEILRTGQLWLARVLEGLVLGSELRVVFRPRCSAAVFLV